MDELVLFFERLTPDAVKPRKGTKGSACYDLYAPRNVTLWPFTPVKIGLGFKIDLTGREHPTKFKGSKVAWSVLDLEMEIRPRSSLSLGQGILVHHGTIDTDYRGEIKVMLMRIWPWPYFIRRGDRIAQARFAISPPWKLNFMAGKVGQTERGSGGFGSTGRS